MKIVVTGGAGFIGSHLCDELLKKDHRVIAFDDLSNGSLDRLSDAFQYKNFKFLKGSILDKEKCATLCRGADVVYHLACLGVRHSLHSPLENHRVNAEGTLRVLEACRKNHTRFMYVSSSEIYGATKEFPITEKTLPCPTTVYGAGKLAGEHYTLTYHRSFGLRATVIRLFNNYGPRAHHERDAGEIIPRTIVRILYGKKPLLFGDDTTTRDFLYVKDAAAALAALLAYPRLDGETLNIGAGEEITMRRLTDRLLFLMGRRDLKPKKLAARPADLPRLWVDAGKFFRLTGFKPSFSLDRGLKETVLYYEKLMSNKNLLSDIEDINWRK